MYCEPIEKQHAFISLLIINFTFHQTVLQCCMESNDPVQNFKGYAWSFHKISEEQDATP